MKRGIQSSQIISGDVILQAPIDSAESSFLSHLIRVSFVFIMRTD